MDQLPKKDKELLQDILVKNPQSLTEYEVKFLNGRRSYLNSEHRRVFASVLVDTIDSVEAPSQPQTDQPKTEYVEPVESQTQQTEETEQKQEVKPVEATTPANPYDANQADLDGSTV